MCNNKKRKKKKKIQPMYTVADKSVVKSFCLVVAWHLRLLLTILLTCGIACHSSSEAAAFLVGVVHVHCALSQAKVL